MFTFLIIVHLLGATFWTGAHLVLAMSVLPEALKENSPRVLVEFEERIEKFEMTALLSQIVSGFWLAYLRLPSLGLIFGFDTIISKLIVLKITFLLGTFALAIHTKKYVIPKLHTEDGLKSMAWHIRLVTLLAVAFVVCGGLIRTGGWV